MEHLNRFELSILFGDIMNNKLLTENPIELFDEIIKYFSSEKGKSSIESFATHMGIVDISLEYERVKSIYNQNFSRYETLYKKFLEKKRQYVDTDILKSYMSGFKNDNVLNLPIFILPVIRGDTKVIFIIKHNDATHNSVVFINCGAGSEFHTPQNNGTCYGLLEFDNIDRDIVNDLIDIVCWFQMCATELDTSDLYFNVFTLLNQNFDKRADEIATKKHLIYTVDNNSSLIMGHMVCFLYLTNSIWQTDSVKIQSAIKQIKGEKIVKYLDDGGVINGFVLETFLESIRTMFNGTEPIDGQLKSKLHQKIESYYEKENLDGGRFECASDSVYEFVHKDAYKKRLPIRELKMGETLEILLLELIDFSKKLDPEWSAKDNFTGSMDIKTIYTNFKEKLGKGIDRLIIKTMSTEYDILCVTVLRLPFLFYKFCKKHNVSLVETFESRLNAEITEMYKLYSKWRIYCGSHPFLNIYKYPFVIMQRELMSPFIEVFKRELLARERVEICINNIKPTKLELDDEETVDQFRKRYSGSHYNTKTITISTILKDRKIGNIRTDFIADINTIPLADGILYRDVDAIYEMCVINDVWFNTYDEHEVILESIFNQYKSTTADIKPLIKEINTVILNASNFDKEYKDAIAEEKSKMGLERSKFTHAEFKYAEDADNIDYIVKYKYISLYTPKFFAKLTQFDVMLMFMQLIYSCKLEKVSSLTYKNNSLVFNDSSEKIDRILFNTPYVDAMITPDTIVTIKSLKHTKFSFFINGTFNTAGLLKTNNGERLNTSYNIAGIKTENYSYIDALLKFLETGDSIYIIKYRIMPYMKFGYVDKDDTTTTINYDEITDINEKSILNNSSINRKLHTADIFIDENTILRIVSYIEKIKTREVTITKKVYNVLVYLLSYLGNIYPVILTKLKEIFDSRMLYSITEIESLSGYDQLVTSFVGFYVCSNLYDTSSDPIYKTNSQKYINKLQSLEITVNYLKDRTDTETISFNYNSQSIAIHKDVVPIEGTTGVKLTRLLSKASEAKFSMEKTDEIVKTEKDLSLKNLIYLNLMMQIYLRYVKYDPIIEYSYDDRFKKEVIYIKGGSDTFDFTEGYFARDNHMYIPSANFYRDNGTVSESTISESVIAKYKHYDISCTATNAPTCNIVKMLSQIEIDGHTYKNSVDFKPYCEIIYDSDFVNAKFIKPYFIGNIRLIDDFEWTPKQDIVVKDFDREKLSSDTGLGIIVRRHIYSKFKKAMTEKAAKIVDHIGGAGGKKGSSSKSGAKPVSETSQQQDIPRDKYDEVFSWLATYPNLGDPPDSVKSTIATYYTAKHRKGYIGTTTDKRYDFKELHIDHIMIGTSKKTTITNENGEQYVRLEDALKVPAMLKLIKRLLNVSDPENIMLWTKDGLLTKVYLLDHRVKFTYFADKTTINNDYEIISEKWAINRWLVDCDNLWLVKDKSQNPFIFVIPRIKMPATNGLLYNDVNVLPIYTGDSINGGNTVLISINQNSKIPDIVNKSDLDLIIKTYKHYNRIDNICELSPVIKSVSNETFIYSKFTNRIPLLDREWSITKTNYTYGGAIFKMMNVLGNFIRSYLASVAQSYERELIVQKKLKNLSEQPKINQLITNVYECALKNRLYLEEIPKTTRPISGEKIDIIVASQDTEKTIKDLLEIKDGLGEEIVNNNIAVMMHVYNTMMILTASNNMTTNTIIKMEEPEYITERYSKEFTLVDSVDYEKLYIDYLFTDKRSYIKPTLLDYYVFALYDNRPFEETRLSDYVASYFFKVLEAKYDRGNDEMKADLEIIRRKIIDKKIKINPLELLYQFAYGFFAREQQLNIVNDVVLDLGKKQIQIGGSLKMYRFIKFDSEPIVEEVTQQSRIHNLVMGGGKTSMITPLSILRLIQIESIKKKNSNNFYVVLPQNLVNQSYTLLRKYLGTYFGLDVQKLTENRATDKEYTDSLRNHSDDDPMTHVYVLSDTSIKCGFINDYKLIKESAKKHFYIIDEVDTVLNPTVSELNYPIGAPIKLGNLEEYYDVLYDILFSIYRENTSNVELNTILNKYKEDWTLEPHFNVINSGSEVVREIQQYAKNRIITYFRGKGDSVNIIKIMNKETVRDLSIRDINVSYAIIAFIETCLPTTLVFINRKNFGLSEKKRETITGLKEPSKLVVPYGYAESPKDLSQFTDPIIVISLTIVDYLIQIKRMPTLTINNMIELIRSTYMATDPLLREQSELYREYTSLRIGISLEDFTSVHQLNDAQIESLIRSKLFIKLLVKKIIDAELEVDTTQLNVAGIDITMSFNIENRSGFTGTPNIPEFRDLYNDKQMIIRDADRQSMGTIETALKNALHLVYSDAPALEYINSVMKDNTDKNVLIDIGAILVGVSHRDIYKIRMKTVPTTTQFIFWNDDDKPICIDNMGFEKPWDGSITKNRSDATGESNINDIFYFYNNKHTTGTDAVIPLGSHGMALIGKNRYRDVVQGIFRMRKLTKGHNITFIINDKIKSYVAKILNVDRGLTPDDFITWFNIEEQKVLRGQIEQMKLQNIRALFKGLPNIESSGESTEFITRKKENPFFVYNTFKYPTVAEATTDIRIVTGERDFVDMELEQLRPLFSDFNELFDAVAPKTKIQSLGEVERMTESQALSINMEMDEQDELAVNNNEANFEDIFEDENKLYTFNTIGEYVNYENIGYHKYLDNVYLSKNIKYFGMPYFVLHCGDNYALIPLIEGLKILDTLRGKRETFGVHKVLIYDTFGNIYYNNTEKLKSDLDRESTVIRFICKKFDNLSYMSIKDFTRAIFLNDVDTAIVADMLEKTSTSDEVFNRYLSCFRTFKEKRTDIRGLIGRFNDRMKAGEPCNVVKDSILSGIEDLDLRASLNCLLKFFTSDYSICYEIQGGGRRLQKIRFIKFPSLGT
jgi:hypothetical protein